MSDWKSLAEKELRGRALSEIDWETLEGIRVKPLYTGEDIENLDHLGGTPGYSPFTRGVKATSIRRFFDR
jgi:methylmalonyl-CoA mutase